MTQSDLFHTRARLFDIKLAKRLEEATVDPAFCRKDFDRMKKLCKEAAGRLMLRAKEGRMTRKAASKIEKGLKDVQRYLKCTHDWMPRRRIRSSSGELCTAARTCRKCLVSEYDWPQHPFVSK